MINDINLLPTKNSYYLKKVMNKTEIDKEDTNDGYYIIAPEKEARRIIEMLKGRKKIIALQGGENHYNRRAIETLNIDYLVSPEGGNKKDTLKQRDSGLNHVVAKEATRKGIGIIINLTEIKKLKGKEKAQRIGRIIQNIIICRKAGCTIHLANLAEQEEELLGITERKAVGISMGMSSKQAQESITYHTKKQ